MSKYKVGQRFNGAAIPHDRTFVFEITEVHEDGQYGFKYGFGDVYLNQTWKASERIIDEYITRYNVLNSPLMKALG